MYACACKGIPEAEVRRVLADGMPSSDELIAQLGLEDPNCCGRCVNTISTFYCPQATGGECTSPVRLRLRAILAATVPAEAC